MHRLTVLIVGNNPGVVKQLASVLAEYDPSHVRRLATNSADALVIARMQSPDLVIVDMPLAEPGDGDIIAGIKAAAGAPKVIVISLYEHYGQTARTSGADEFVSKTAPRSTLLAALRRHCDAVDSSGAE